MAIKNYAAIDIGSNAVRLLIKRVSPGYKDGIDKLSKVLLLRVPLRLGFDVFGEGKISSEKADRMRRLMKAYRQLMKIYGVEHYRACATSAMRDAVNGMDIIKMIKKNTGIKIEIIDGQEEAQIVYNNHLECQEAFNIGTVRILTGGVTEAAWQQMRDEIATHTKEYPVINIIGSGGNINKLYRLIEKKDKKRKRIPVASLQQIYDRLKILTPEARMDEFNLKPDRADVIVPASEIFLCIAEKIHAEYIYVPEIGLSDGIIDKMYAEDKMREQYKKL